MIRAKERYCCTLNWYSQTFTLWLYTTNKDSAFWLSTLRLSKVVDRSHYIVRQYFDGQKDNILIERR